MATAELCSRRDFILFAKKRGRSGGNQPSPHRPDSSASQPRSPRRPSQSTGPEYTRRQAIPIIAGATLLGTGAVAYLLDPFHWFRSLTPDSPKQNETLESLVSQAKKMEAEYKGSDLSDKKTRDQYANLLSEIFVRYYPLGVSKDELVSSIIWFDSTKDYEEIFISKNQDPYFSNDYLRQMAAERTAFPDKHDGKLYINATDEIFNKARLSRKFPGWNPLMVLRLTLFHEFSHQITIISQDTGVFAVVDRGNEIQNKAIEGFEISGDNAKKEHVGIYHLIDEASVELLSKYINNDLFHSFISDYSNNEGDNITNIMNRFEGFLKAAGITRMELAQLHQDSNLKGLLLLLAERGGVNPRRISEPDRIAFGFTLFEASIRNNQAILQDYTKRATK